MFGNAGKAWVKRFGEWETIHDTGRHCYQQHTKTGKRRVQKYYVGGYSAINHQWLDGGDWEIVRPPPPPRPTKPKLKTSIYTVIDVDK